MEQTMWHVQKKIAVVTKVIKVWIMFITKIWQLNEIIIQIFECTIVFIHINCVEP